MKWFKYTLVLMVWVAATWPCLHTVSAADHLHKDMHGAGLCSFAHHECHCHSCDEVPCSDQKVELVRSLSVSVPFGFQLSKVPLFILAEPRSFCVLATSRPSDTLIALKTVQLLT